MFAGKLFGSALGYFIFGFYGAAVGFLFGFAFDKGRSVRKQTVRRQDNRRRGGGIGSNASARRKERLHRTDGPQARNPSSRDNKLSRGDTRAKRPGKGQARKPRGIHQPPPSPATTRTSQGASSGSGARSSRVGSAPAGSAFAVLGVSTKADKQTVKNAYRKLMSAYHPDKLASKGLSKEQLASATAKAQKVQKAYMQINKSKGW